MLWSLAVLALLLSAPATANVRSFGISQAIQLDEELPTVRVYLEATGEDDRIVRDIEPTQLTATLGDKIVSLRDSYPFRIGGEGVAYVFLIDISKSLSNAEFDLILEALDVWILSLRPSDRAAVVAFGDASRVVVDFTADQATIKAALYSLGPSDNQTVLHEALEDGLELCRRRDPDLPGRRVIMVLTDGRDEGSGLTTEDVLESLRHDPVPIYAIGLSRIQNSGERRRYLDLLHRYAANSGGAFYEGSTKTLGTAYEAIRRDIHGVWVADFVCPSCRTDGDEYRLQVQLEDRGRVLSSGRSLRLLPGRRSAAAQAAAAAAGTPAPAAVQSAAPSTATQAATGRPEERERSGVPFWVWLLIPVVVAAAVAAWFHLRHRKADDGKTAEPPAEIPELPPLPGASAPGARKPGDVEILDVVGVDDDTPPKRDSQPVRTPQTYVLDSGVETTRPPRPAIMRLVRLIVVRGSKPGRQYTLTLFQNAVVGSRSTCDCVLPDPGVAPEQFEILQHDGRVYIRNLAGTRPTLVDGLPLEEQHPLKSDSLVGNRDFIVRVTYEEARPVNT